MVTSAVSKEDGNQSSSKFFNLLSNFDQYLFKSRFLRKFAWSALIVGKKI